MVFGWFHKSPASSKGKQHEDTEFEETTTAAPVVSPPTHKPVSGSEFLRQQRARLYEVIGECMIASGILSAGYKFKVLSADAQHEQFLILFDLATEFATDTHQLAAMEQLIQTTALRRYKLLVRTCYWRVVPDPAVLAANQTPATESAESPPGQASAAPSASQAREQLAALFPTGVPQGQETAFAPTEIGSLGQPEKVQSYVMLTGYESTELAQSEFRSTEIADKR